MVRRSHLPSYSLRLRRSLASTDTNEALAWVVTLFGTRFAPLRAHSRRQTCPNTTGVCYGPSSKVGPTARPSPSSAALAAPLASCVGCVASGTTLKASILQYTGREHGDRRLQLQLADGRLNSTLPQGHNYSFYPRIHQTVTLHRIAVLPSSHQIQGRLRQRRPST